MFLGSEKLYDGVTGTRLAHTPYKERRIEPHGAGKECVSVVRFLNF
jgi:hypothetical protein